MRIQQLCVVGAVVILFVTSCVHAQEETAPAQEQEQAPETLQINTKSCPTYARDGQIARQMIVDGRTRAMVVEHWTERKNRYTEIQWPYAMSLLARAFETRKTPTEFYQELVQECIQNNGVLPAPKVQYCRNGSPTGCAVIGRGSFFCSFMYRSPQAWPRQGGAAAPAGQDLEPARSSGRLWVLPAHANL